MIKMFVITLFVAFGFMVVSPVTAEAATAANCKGDSSFLGLPTWYKYLNPTFANDECNITFDVTKDVPKVLLAVFEIALRLGGVVAAGFVLFGGVQYVISQGEPEKVKGARTTIINALVGIVIVTLSVTIVNLIGGAIR